MTLIHTDMNPCRRLSHPLARGLAVALLLPLVCQPGCKSKPKDADQPADKSGAELGRSKKSSTRISTHLNRSDYESQLAGILRIDDAEERRKAFAAWMAGLKGYGERAAAAQALVRLVQKDDSPQDLFPNDGPAQTSFQDYLRAWAAKHPAMVDLWMNGYVELMEEGFSARQVDTGTPEGHEEEMKMVIQVNTAWDTVVEGLVGTEDVEAGILAATNAPRGQDASWSDGYDTLANRWIEQRGLDDASDEAMNLPDSLMQDVVYNNICTGLIKESPAKAAAWTSELDGPDRNLLLMMRGVEIYKAWQDKAAADAWLDSLGEDGAESIRANTKEE